MGLDAYVLKKKPAEAEPTELWYGRKENEIHGWMQRESGIPADEFNCEDLELTQELLLKLEKDFAAGELMPTSGFFFGGAGTYEQVEGNVQAILKGARQALAEGYEVRYTSWW